MVPRDAANIAATLPLLQPQQREDVLKFEDRVETAPDGEVGMMFTNGTGTGKTFTGLGVVKRYARQGKKNTLIIAPSDKVLNDWKKTASNFFDLDVSILPNTKAAGEGIVATSYAALGSNETLADRDWDLIVADESHYFNNNQTGEPTGAQRAFRAISGHPGGVSQRARMQLRDKLREVSAGPGSDAALRYNDEILKAREAELKDKPRSHVVFLSATPFAYDKNVDYAEGFLFSYDRKHDRNGGYNQPNAQGAFMQQHFGYRMRTGKLTRPDAEVDSSVLERQFHEWLKSTGALSARELEVEADYERRFAMLENAEGAKIDQALEWLATARGGRYLAIYDAVQANFSYLKRRQLLEAIKAKEITPTIRKLRAEGRKVVVFHDYNVGGGFNPFRLTDKDGYNLDINKEVDVGGGEMVKLGKLFSEFVAANPYVKGLNFSEYLPPVDELSQAFPDALIFNGKQPKKERRARVEQFNEDGSDALLIVQSDAGAEGISLHDTTGEHKRVLINLGMPTRPTRATQIEGRIYRVGQVTDALILYPTTGSGWERSAFAGSIAERAATAENLAMGDRARGLRDSFIDAYADAELYEPGETDGRGGKDRDRSAARLSPWNKAKSLYFAQGKRTPRTKSREGVDYFATPEPVGLKMVQFADPKFAETILEPSAGHGAIARWFPDGTQKTIIEPSPDLMSRASLASPGAKGVMGRFEDHALVNKYDSIVMNPPFGSGGKTAIEHLAKAARHVRNGGRIVALIPTGPAADAKFEKFFEDPRAKGLHIVAKIKLPPVLFERAGTSVLTQIVVFEKQMDADVAVKIRQTNRDYSNAESINELFDRMENLELPPRLEPQTKEASFPDKGDVTVGLAQFKLSNTRSGTAKARIVNVGRVGYSTVRQIADKHGARVERNTFAFRTKDDRTAFLQEVSEAPERQSAPQSAQTAERATGGVAFKTGETKHGRTGEDLFVATFRGFQAREVFDQASRVAKKHGGYYSGYDRRGAIPGFQFASEGDRAAFLDEMAGGSQNRYALAPVRSTKAPLEGFSMTTRRAIEQTDRKSAQPKGWENVFIRAGVTKGELAWLDWDGFKSQFSEQEKIPVERVQEWIDENTPRLEEHNLGYKEGGASSSEPSLADYDVTPSSFREGASENQVRDSFDDFLTERRYQEFGEFLGAELEQFDPYDPISALEVIDLASEGRGKLLSIDYVDEDFRFYPSSVGVERPDGQILMSSGERFSSRAEGEHIINRRHLDSLIEAYGEFDEDGDNGRTKFSAYVVRGGENYREILVRDPALDWRSPHFDDQEIVHIRADDRTVSGVGRVLFVQEIQSDLHQRGRKYGYRPKGGGGDSVMPPRAPLEDRWTELGVKVALRKATEEGYDAVAFARSEQIGEAVGNDGTLGPHYDVKIPNFTQRYVKQWGASVERIGVVDEAKNPLVRITPEMRESLKAKPQNFFALAPVRAALRTMGAGTAQANRQAHQALYQRNYETLIGEPGGESRDPGALLTRFDRLRAEYQDAFIAPMRMMQEAQRRRGRALQDYENVYLQEKTYAGRVGDKMSEVQFELVEPVMEAMRMTGLTMAELDEYLMAKHAPERNAQIARINPNMPDGGSGMSTADANRVLRQYESGRHAMTLRVIRRLMRRMRVRALRWRVDAGLMTPAHAKAWLKAYRHYVPLKGWDDISNAPTDEQTKRQYGGESNQPIGGGKQLTIKGAESRRAIGRGDGNEAANPFVQFITDTEEAIIRGEKNRILLSLLDMARASDMADFVEEVSVVNVRVFNPSTGLVETVARNPLTVAEEPNHVTVKEGGYEKRIRFNDMAVAKAFKQTGNIRLEGAMRVAQSYSMYFSTVTTTYNPAFVFVNMARDIGAFTVTAPRFRVPGMRRKVAGYYFSGSAYMAAHRGLRGNYKGEWGRWFKRFQAAGGKISFFDIGGVESKVGQYRRRIGAMQGEMTLGDYELLRNVGGVNRINVSRLHRYANIAADAVELVNLAADNALRLSVFRAAVESGVSEQEAAAMARDVTVDFNKKGFRSAYVNALYTFFNAGVQGTETLLRAVTRSRAVQANIALLVVAGFAQEMLNGLLGDEDDDGQLPYDKLNDYQLEHNAIFMVAGEPVMVPLQYGINIPYNIGRIIARSARAGMGDNIDWSPGKAVRSIFGTVAEAVFPLYESVGDTGPLNRQSAIKTLSPTISDPLVEIATNRTFTGGSIRPDNPYDLAPETQQYYDNVSDFSKFAANAIGRATGGSKYEAGAIDMSPEDIDHVTSELAGGGGAFLMRVADAAGKALGGKIDQIENYDIPILRRFRPEVGIFTDRSLAYDRMRESAGSMDGLKNALLDQYEAGRLEGFQNIELTIAGNLPVRVAREWLAKSSADDGERVGLSRRAYYLAHLEERIRGVRQSLAAFRRQRVKAETLSNDERRAKIEEIDAKEKVVLDQWNRAFMRAIKKGEIEPEVEELAKAG